MQRFKKRISDSFKAFGLSLSIVMFHCVPGNLCWTSYFVGSNNSESCLPGLRYSCSLHSSCREPLNPSGHLSRVWSPNGIKKQTKLSFHRACVLTSLSYSLEIWVIYKRHVRVLGCPDQRSLRQILNVGGTLNTPDIQIMRTINILKIGEKVHRYLLNLDTLL